MSENLHGKEELVFTIGHSNHTLEHFIGLLNSNHIEFLVDVRTSPYSKYNPHFNGENLAEGITSSGIEYMYLGKEMGGIPDKKEFYDESGHVLYDRIAETDEFLECVSSLEKVIGGHRAALMCGEEDPSGCHRRLLIGRVLSGKGIKVIHIRGDGSLQTEDELIHEESQKPENRQLRLFETEEDSEWKSIRSVLPKRLQRNSSGR